MHVKNAEKGLRSVDNACKKYDEKIRHLQVSEFWWILFMAGNWGMCWAQNQSRFLNWRIITGCIPNGILLFRVHWLTGNQIVSNLSYKILNHHNMTGKNQNTGRKIVTQVISFKITLNFQSLLHSSSFSLFTTVDGWLGCFIMLRIFIKFSRRNPRQFTSWMFEKQMIL